MSRQASDFRQGVEAAAKWLREKDCREYHFGPNGFDQNGSKEMARSMLLTIADDPEGTESRTVAQIVRFMRECGYGGDFGEVNSVIQQLADDIAAGDWKRS